MRASEPLRRGGLSQHALLHSARGLSIKSWTEVLLGNTLFPILGPASIAALFLDIFGWLLDTCIDPVKMLAPLGFVVECSLDLGVLFADKIVMPMELVNIKNNREMRAAIKPAFVLVAAGGSLADGPAL